MFISTERKKDNRIEKNISVTALINFLVCVFEHKNK